MIFEDSDWDLRNGNRASSFFFRLCPVFIPIDHCMIFYFVFRQNRRQIFNPYGKIFMAAFKNSLLETTGMRLFS